MCSTHIDRKLCHTSNTSLPMAPAAADDLQQCRTTNIFGCLDQACSQLHLNAYVTNACALWFPAVPELQAQERGALAMAADDLQVPEHHRRRPVRPQIESDISAHRTPVLFAEPKTPLPDKARMPVLTRFGDIDVWTTVHAGLRS